MYAAGKEQQARPKQKSGDWDELSDQGSFGRKLGKLL